MISVRVDGFLAFCFQIEVAEIWKDTGAGGSQENSGCGKMCSCGVSDKKPNTPVLTSHLCLKIPQANQANITNVKIDHIQIGGLQTAELHVFFKGKEKYDSCIFFFYPHHKSKTQAL